MKFDKTLRVRVAKSSRLNCDGVPDYDPKLGILKSISYLPFCHSYREAKWAQNKTQSSAEVRTLAGF